MSYDIFVVFIQNKLIALVQLTTTAAPGTNI